MNNKYLTEYNNALEEYRYSDCDGDNNIGIKLNEEKFAELLIKECARLCRDKYINSDDISLNTGIAFSNLILDNFGVKNYD